MMQMNGVKMSDKCLPGNHHISRYCTPTRVRESDGRPSPQAFQLRDADLKDAEPFLSVNWLELLHTSDLEIQLDKLRSIHPMNLSANGKFAILNVDESKISVKNQTDNNHEIEIKHRPDKNPAHDDPHSGIFNMDQVLSRSQKIRLRVALCHAVKNVQPGLTE
jgi:hypothetical protein